MNAFTFPQAGERRNSSAVPAPDKLLRDLVLSVVNGTSLSNCPGCDSCRTFQRAAYQAWLLLSDDALLEVDDYAARMGVNIETEWAEA